eukprot:gnl/TRDRNA2_/TRDRNA2_197067_c0_seq1.p1 gnl/TRDRNA2_/TRDRNA2_197067_c0~~gnl/TRDRNA2_/TRDRNA2_197067_c0_seq1.p1  ORF type:complete len:252 (-),score=19.57 gnl/TRDRNA2_/TRDRNA2_197067_c0_seq1:129-830(-)
MADGNKSALSEPLLTAEAPDEARVRCIVRTILLLASLTALLSSEHLPSAHESRPAFELVAKETGVQQQMLKQPMHTQRPVQPSKAKKIFQRLLNTTSDLASIGSILCAINCTILPLVIAILPLIGNLPMGWVHKVSRICALGVVGPISSLAVVFNCSQHKNALVGIWGFCGIILILCANITFPRAFGRFVSAHHSLMSFSGCLLLISSQLYARRLIRMLACSHCCHSAATSPC